MSNYLAAWVRDIVWGKKKHQKKKMPKLIQEGKETWRD